MMKTWMIVLSGVAALSLVQLLNAPNAISATPENGRFAGVEASETAVWVIDTQTGRVRKCTQEFADSTPRCSDFSQQ